MQTEARFFQDSTASIFGLEDSFALDQSGTYNPPRLLPPGTGSFAISPHAASLEKEIAESLNRMLHNRGYEVVVGNPMGSSFFPMLVDIACFEPATEQALVESREEERLAYRLRMAFEIEPFEDGMDHPADQIIENALRSSGSQSILDWLSAFCLDTERPNLGELPG